MSWLSVVSVPVFSWAEHRSRSRSLLTKQQTVPKMISTVTFGLLLKMLPCCYHSLGCWSHLVDDSVICNVGVFKSTEGIAPIRSVKQKPTDQKLKCCFKNVMENSQLFPSVCIFFFLLFIPFYSGILLNAFLGCTLYFFINLFLYCWCQNLNYCGLNLFNKQNKNPSQLSVFCWGFSRFFLRWGWYTFLCVHECWTCDRFMV